MAKVSFSRFATDLKNRSPSKTAGRIVDYQSVVTDAGVDDKRLLVGESEFATPLRIAKRDGSTRSPTDRQVWESSDLRVLQKKSLVKATNTHVSILGHITKGELLR